MTGVDFGLLERAKAKTKITATLTVAQHQAALKAQFVELAKNRREREVLEALAGWIAHGLRLVPPKAARKAARWLYR